MGYRENAFERGERGEGKGERGTERTGRTNRRDPIYETHMYRYDIMRTISRWFGMR